MKYSKGVYVTSHDIKSNCNRVYQVYANKRDTINNHSKDFSCQYNSKRDNIICTCKRTTGGDSGHYFNISHQVYTSQRFKSAWGFRDVGVGSVKPVPKKRVRRIYLPDTEDRGVGSEDLTSFIRKPRIRTNYYDQKKTSSKCVGGMVEYKNTALLNEKSSPICNTKSASTSLRRASFEEIKANDKHLIIPDPIVTLKIGRKHGRGDKIDKNKTELTPARLDSKVITTNVDNPKAVRHKYKTKSMPATNEEKDFSSDSLVQHVHNLENSSSFRQSKLSIDLIENKLERVFSVNSKHTTKPIPEVNPIQGCTSNSFRKRFETLGCGLNKKEMSIEHSVVIKPSSHNSITSKKDVSISSDPPSLEARSFIYTAPSPASYSHKYDNAPHSSHRKTGKDSSHWSTDAIETEYQNVKGMFKLWGEKFNLEDDCYNKTSTDASDVKKKKKVEVLGPKEEETQKEKKEGKRFSFFKRKNKDKSKQPYKPKKSVTAGRCEVGDGLLIKIGAANDYYPETLKPKLKLTQEEYDDMLRKKCMKRILDSKSDSRNSVKIRWHNEMYATSSSTVFELMECIYKNTGIIFRSKSEITVSTESTVTTIDTTVRDIYRNPQVNFMQQTLQAWMIPDMVVDKTVNAQNSKRKKNIEVTISNQKWFIEKTKALSQKIEFVLHSKNIVKKGCNSSEYLVIDIPKGYFSDSASDDEEQCQSSDEKVYNIVEYLTAKSRSDLRKKGDRQIDTDGELNNVCVTVNVQDPNGKESKGVEKVIKTPPRHRDVIVQGSNVHIPKRCDVIGVGIITQQTHNRDIKDIEIPRLQLHDDITEDESKNTIPPQKRCEFAESYLQEYYRNCNPLGIDLYSWCFSESNLRGSSDNNSVNSLNKGDGTKSCPGIYNDYQTDVVSSSETTSSVSHGATVEDTNNIVDDTTAYFNKFKKKDKSQLPGADGKRVLPKDSVEVFKRRKIYAQSKKVDQCASNEGSAPFSVPSLLDKFAQKMSSESSKSSKSKKCDTENSKLKKKVKKRVSLKDVEKKIGDGILSFKGSFVCKKIPCPKSARVDPEPTEMLEAPCKEKCQKKRKPPCSKQGSPTCLVRPPPPCPSGSPSPCVAVCPPIAPPCAPNLAGFPSSSPKQSNSIPPDKSPPSTPPKSPTPKSRLSFLKCPVRKSTSKSPPSSPPKASPKLRPKSTMLKSRFSQLKCPLRKSPSKSFTASSPPSPKSSCTSPPKSSPSKSRCSMCKSYSKSPPLSPSSSLKSPPKSSSSNSRLRCKLCKSHSKSPHSSPSLSPQSSPKQLQRKKSPLCKESCVKEKKPPCSKHNSPSCLVPPICPAGPPSRCRPPCFPINNGKSSQPEKSTSPSSPLNPSPPRRSKSLPSSSPKSCKSFTEPCGCNPQMSCGLPQCASTKKAKFKTSPKNSGITIKKPPSSKFASALKRLASICSTTKKGFTSKKEANLSKKDSVTNNDSKTSKNDGGDCDPDCLGATVKKGSDERKFEPPHSTPSLCPPTKRARSQPKMSGVHLKMKPLPRKSSTECQPDCTVIKLNSKENMIIRRKPKTPSTEQIREGCNIKVQDEDGVTLYERRDYKMDTAQTRKYLVKDMYRDSQIHRVATSKADIDTNDKHLESSASNLNLSNIVEINLNLKFKQNDKSQVDVKNCTPKGSSDKKVSEASISEVYLLRDKGNHSINRIEETERRDVNIKIIINSYHQSPKPKKKMNSEHQHADDVFAKKISEKFTVSTGYSDVLDQPTFSVHRATVNFTDSTETNGHHIKPNDKVVSEEMIETGPIILTDNESMIKNSTLTRSDCLIANKKVDSQVLQSDISEIKSSKTDVENTVSTYDDISVSVSGTDEAFSDNQHSNTKIPKMRNKEEKKKMLKQIFEWSSKTDPQNKSKLRRIRKMLQAVFTSDSSGYEDVTSNKLAKELTYESLKPNFFKDTDSMTNYYQLSMSDKSKTDIEDILYPSEMEISTDSEELNEKSRCLCSLLANKLNICENNKTKACCCKGKTSINEEIHCDLIKDLTVYKTKYIDVETQDSAKSQTKNSVTTMSSNTPIIQLEKKTEKYEKLNKIFKNVPKRILSYSSNIKACRVKKSNAHTVLGITEDDKVIVMNSKVNTNEINVFRNKNSNKVKPLDILQFHETKRAVLEIYAEKSQSDRNGHLIAKLPKFWYERESYIYKYQNLIADVEEFSERNTTMMSIPR